jgi:hypothetical protein
MRMDSLHLKKFEEIIFVSKPLDQNFEIIF